MLQSIRNRTTGIVALILIGGIGVAMTIGLVDMNTGIQARDVAASVNGEDIAAGDFRQIAQRELVEREQQTGMDLSATAREEVERSVLENMVRNRVVAQYVNAQGFRVGDAQVADLIRSMEVFQVGGQFSPEGYQAALASQGISPAAFEEERRVALQIGQLQNGLLESAFFTPAEFRRFVVLDAERRQVAFAVLDIQSALASVSVTDEDARAYYDQHPERFESEESVALDYVLVSADDMPAAAEPSEAELRASYDANPGRFRAAEQRRARHILIAVSKDVDDQAAASKAADIRARLAQGEDFAALAREFSDDGGSAANGGELGWAAQGTYVEAFDNALFAARPGDISQPVKTEFGYHIIQLEEVRAGVDRSFSEARNELLAEARARSTQDRFYGLLEKMDDAALENPGSLEAVASVAGTPVRHIEEFTRSAGAEPFGADRAVVNAAFGTAVVEGGENSALVELADERAVVLRVTQHRPAELQAFDKVRAQVEAEVRMQKAAALAAERGRHVVEELRAGADFAATLAAAGATPVVPAEPVSRNSPTVPPEILAAIFKAPHPGGGTAAAGGSIDGLSLANGSYAVFRVDDVLPGRPEDVARTDRDARKDVLARQTGVREGTGVATDLRKAAKVVVAPGLFDQQDNF
ncbi:MAG: SurA N-terminal domain-containing protein [Gammaproteobacteria bacterium]|nr:SurA N-terminal domain-containing protein [Gammaproteobacteria bacterium]